MSSTAFFRRISSLPTGNRPRFWASLLVFLFAFALYGRTAGPGIIALFDDSLEFQLVGPTLGIAHPSGYPLYTLLAFFWSRMLLPMGNWAWRMNLFSAFWGALTLALLFHLTTRLVTRADGRANWWAGLAAVAAAGVVPVWWQQATVAEVYTLHNALMLALMDVAIGINRTLDAPGAFRRRMTWIAFLAGLGLAHHRTSALLLPGLALYLLWSVPNIWKPRRAWLAWAGAFLAPLLLYGLIPLRAGMGVTDLNGAYVNSWTGFWDHVLARRYGAFFADNALAVTRTPRDWLALFVYEMGAPALLLALLGLPWLADRRGKPVKAWIFVFVVGLTNLIFALNYHVGDVEVFLLPVFLCLAMFAGAGVGTLERLLTPRSPVAGRVAQAAALLLLLAAGRDGVLNRSQEWAIHDYAEAMARVDFPPDSMVVGLEGEMTALKYMQQAEGLAANAAPIVADDPARRAQLVADGVAAGQPVYLTREIAGIEALYSFSADGPLVRVWPRGEIGIAAYAQPLDVAMADGALRLLGYDADVLAQHGGPALSLALYWQPDQAIDRNYKLSLRIVDEAGAPLTNPNGETAVADRFPLRQVAPTWSWKAGEIVRDVQIIQLPPGWESARLQVILYDAESVAEAGRWELNLSNLRP
ncbi:MAG: DUF2723 domain-containing protein [Caldilineaceae bacterium]|nr:DUF2723 domain-containing protein [Caldilineaceae bacterium]